MDGGRKHGHIPDEWFESIIKPIHKERNREILGICQSCGSFESAKHFILFCNAYTDERLSMFANIKQQTDENTFKGTIHP